MGDFLKEVEGKIKKIYQENQNTRSEDLFCRKCESYFASKSDFSQHVREHIEETNDGRTSHMRYIEKYICNSCGQQFELKSDLNIHYTTVCLDAPYTCKHCKENCENDVYLQMHLVFHHKYSKEMLRDEGFSPNIRDNPFASENSFMKSSRSKTFKSAPPEDALEFHTVDKSTSPKASNSNTKSQTVGRKRQSVVYKSVNKAHTCEICNESFSRKCVLEFHAKKHVLKRTKEKRMAGDILQTSAIMELCENTKKESKNIDSAEVPGQHSNSPRAILKPSNIIVGSSIWKKVQPKRKLPGAKTSTRSVMRRSKISDIFEDKAKDSSTHKGIYRLSNVVADYPARKKYKLRSRIPSFEASYMQNDPEKSKKKIKLRNKNSDIAASVEQEGPEALKKNVKRRSKTKNAAVSDEQKVSETSNIAMISESRKAKEHKKPPQNLEKKDFICETCKKQFQDNFKLKRHLLIHTGERPYTCTKCKKTFARDDHMKRHLKKVCNKTGN